MSRQHVYDLGELGLSDGDPIDPYLDDYWETGNEVHIPEGTYDWNGDHLGGTINDAALIGDGDGATFEIPDGGDVHNTLAVSEGSTLVTNITVRGTAGDGKNRIRIEASEPEATLTMDSFDLPDGGYGFGEHPSPIGFYVPPENEGTVNIRRCFIQGFPNNGVYSSKGPGITSVECCHLVHNNIDNIRLGPNDEIHDCLIEMTDLGDGCTGRGVRVRYDGTQVIDGLHIINDGGPRPLVSARNDSARCSLTDVYIENNADVDAIQAATGTFRVMEDVHVTGEGSWATTGDITDEQLITKGSDATPPERAMSAICEDRESDGSAR